MTGKIKKQKQTCLWKLTYELEQLRLIKTDYNYKLKPCSCLYILIGLNIFYAGFFDRHWKNSWLKHNVSICGFVIFAYTSNLFHHLICSSTYYYGRINIDYMVTKGDTFENSLKQTRFRIAGSYDVFVLYLNTYWFRSKEWLLGVHLSRRVQ